MYVLTFSTTFVKYTLFLSYFNETHALDRFSKRPEIRFQENPSSGRRVIPRGQADRHDEDFQSFAKAPKKNIWGRDRAIPHPTILSR